MLSDAGVGPIDGGCWDHGRRFVVVDRSVEAVSGHVVVAVLGGEMTIKRLRKRPGMAVLKAEHPDYPEIVIDESSPVEIWGVVVGCIRKMG